jgi:hypothetical protein
MVKAEATVKLGAPRQLLSAAACVLTILLREGGFEFPSLLAPRSRDSPAVVCSAVIQ